MGAAIGLREDFGSADLRALARTVKDAGQARRLLALAAIYDGGRRTEAAKIGSVGLQIIRDWVLRFNAHGPDGLIADKAPGNPSKLNDDKRRALEDIVERGPIPAIHGVVRWRLIDLMQWVWEEFGISLSDRPGQCLVSDGFETRIGRADKVKPIRTGKFPIHTLGQLHAFAGAPNQVGHPAVTRRSGPAVGNAAVGRPRNAPGRTHALCQVRTVGKR